MSSAILPGFVSQNAVVPAGPAKPERRIANADSLHRSDSQPAVVVVFCNLAETDPDTVVSGLRERGCIVTRANLGEANFERDAEALTHLSQAIRQSSPWVSSIAAVSVVAPYRGPSLTPQCLEFDRLLVDRRRHIVRVADRQIEFSKTELDLLFLLASYPGIVLSRRELVEACKGEAYPATDRSIDVQIVGIRRKLGPIRHYLQTVRGIGYRFDPQAPRSEHRTASPK